MVMILTKTRENKGADSVTCRTELHTPKMSQGPTLFSCGVMGSEEFSRKAAHSQTEGFSCDPHGNPAAPPSKRQCRSLSFSDEMSSCGTSWRPLGSKVWTPVEKRRCYSGGSVQRYSNGFATMQRSSSFSLPSRSNPLSCEHPALSSRLGCPPRKSAAGGHGGDRVDMQRSLSCSHDRFSSTEYCPPSASSTPASTPELGRRAGGLSRSRSQPCVLNDKKVGVKRRRPEEVQEQRPSLDLAKMTQVRGVFSTISCPSAAPLRLQ
ncbi:PREDICTED: protein FAM53B [Charadrius vociferus]|uniref:protein FAM53B n=1 Tax=Charadrius vociferus TaxID=50402 RepID=UPI0005214689|nr:PREDICTED: protein FAM53B [Charadrius vociferus]